RPLSKQDALTIVNALRPKYESHHNVKILDEALTAAVELSDEYPNRFFPRKALQLLDEASSHARISAIKKAFPHVANIDAQLEQLNQEKEAAVAEQDFEKAAHLRDRADKLKQTREK